MMNIEYTAEQMESQRQACIAAYASGLLEIVIDVDTDLTPKGKRTARIVQTDRNGRQLRWYVGGRIYREFSDISAKNVELTKDWMSN